MKLTSKKFLRIPDRQAVATDEFHARLHVGAHHVNQPVADLHFDPERLKLRPRHQRFGDGVVERGRHLRDGERIGRLDWRPGRAEHHRVQARPCGGDQRLRPQQLGALIFKVHLGAKHLELGRRARGAAVPRDVHVPLFLIDGAPGYLQLLDGEQQLVVALNGQQRRPLPCAPHIFVTRSPRKLRRAQRMTELEAEQRLRHVGVRVEAVKRNRGERGAELVGKLIEVGAVQQPRIPGAKGARGPGHVGQRVGASLGNTPFEERDLFEAQLHRGVDRKRLRHGLRARELLCRDGRRVSERAEDNEGDDK